jgi:hypothetical protein
LRLVILLRVAGGLFVLLAVVATFSGGLQFNIAGARISATSPSRLLFEGAVILLLSTCGAGLNRPRTLLAAIALFLVAAAADSELRRVGDGFEYLSMARNLSRAAPPSVAEEEASALATEMAAHGDRSWAVQLMPALRADDSRYDFPHFWMCSLLAAPFVAIAAAAGAHPAIGFTALNVILMLGVCWLLMRAGAGLVAVLFAVLMVWWIDKAHAEIFFAALVGGALLLRTTAPAPALLLLGVAAAQGPVLAVLLAGCAAEALWRNGPRPRLVLAAAAALLIAALHPLYYLWRLGTASPLTATVIPHVPGVRALVTPLVDLNLGIVWFAPLLCGLTLAGAVLALRRRSWGAVPLAVGALALLVAAAQAVNVNHGGTPGPSRYGVWTLAILLPLAVDGAARLRWKTAAGIATAATVIFSVLVLHPDEPDRGITPSPTALAALVWTRVPVLDNPLPEVFAERVAHQDGIAGLPMATPRCEKVLLVADATGVAWPLQCEARAVPDACAVAGAVCYANGARIVTAPFQPGFQNTVSTR